MSQRTLARREALTSRDISRGAALAAQNRDAADNPPTRALVPARPGSPLEHPTLDLTACPLAKAYPHWDGYIADHAD